MKTFSRRSFQLSLVNMVWLGLVLSGATRPAHAQSTIAGKFTLPFEARWGNKVLSAGNYSYSIESIGGSMQNVTSIASGYQPVLVVVRAEAGGPAKLILGTAKWQKDHSAVASGLAIDATPDGPTIRTLCLETFGIVLDFQASKAKAVMYAKAPQLGQPASTSKAGN